MTLHYLSAADVLIVAEPACGETELVLRDVNSLESAAHRPRAEMYGQQVHPDLIDKAAALLQTIAINHPLFDGNKRTAWLSCVTLFQRQNFAPNAHSAHQVKPQVSEPAHLRCAPGAW